MRIIKWKYYIKREKVKLSKRKNFKVGVERTRNKQELRKCALLCEKLKTEDIEFSNDSSSQTYSSVPDETEQREVGKDRGDDMATVGDSPGGKRHDLRRKGDRQVGASEQFSGACIAPQPEPTCCSSG